MSIKIASVEFSFTRLVLVGVGIALFAAPGCRDQEQTFSLRLEDSGPTIREVVVDSDNGPVKLVGSQRSDISVTARVTLRAPDDKAAEIFEVLKPTIGRASDNPEQVEIHFHVPRELKSTYAWADLQIELPSAVYANVRTHNGRINAGHLEQGSNLHSSNGSIEVENLIGMTKVQTSNGRVSAVEIDGDATIQTSNGAVTAVNVSGGLSITTSNGRIKVAAEQVPFKPITLRTSNGAIDVTLPQASEVGLDLSTSNSGVSVQGAKELQLDSQGKHSLVGHTGATDPKVEARTSNGRIQVSFVN
jgi:hypothetical protein